MRLPRIDWGIVVFVTIVATLAVVSCRDIREQDRKMAQRCEAMLRSATAVDSLRIFVVQPRCAP